MHEFSIARSVIDKLKALAKEYGREVVSATVAVGPMSMIVPGLLVEAYRALSQGTGLAGSELHIEQVPVTAVCNECGAVTEGYQPFVRCSQCHSLNLSLESGYELHIVSAELRDGNQTPPDP